MKKITVVCQDIGFATVETTDINIENENAATQVEIDFSATSYSDQPKWVDLIMKNGTSLRYDLGDAPIVSFELDYASTIQGEMIITPFIYNGTLKTKYKTNSTITIHEQKEAGTSDAPVRDDFIFELRKQYDVLEAKVLSWDTSYEEVVVLAEGESVLTEKLINFDFLFLQVVDSALGHVSTLWVKPCPEIVNATTRVQLRKAPLSYATLTKTNGNVVFDVLDDGDAPARVGAIATLYGVTIREVGSNVPGEDGEGTGADFYTEDTIFVASNGNDIFSGASPSHPKATLQNAVLTAKAGDTIIVIDGNEYTVGTLELPEGVKIDARNATIIGNVELNTGSVFECRNHYPEINNAVMLRNKGTGLSYYKAILSDGRGLDGTITGVTNIQNQTPNAILFTDVELMFTNKNGIIDATTGDGGHIHFNLKDLYMVADGAVALEADKNNSNLIGYIDHILNLGGLSASCTAIYVANGARCTLTVGEIRIGSLNTGYNVVGTGLLNLNSLENDAIRIGTANDLLARLEALESV